jgi:hypothetical protein
MRRRKMFKRGAAEHERPNHKIVPGDGDPCTRCGRPMEIREHVSITPRELARPFYLRRWFKCTNPKCRTTLVMPPRFVVRKREPKREPRVANEMTMMSYPEYLKSSHWLDLKENKARRTARRCGLCGSTKQLDCHHVLYRNLIDVQTSDLRWLCRECHSLVHELLASGKIRVSEKNRLNPQLIWVATQGAIAREKRKRKNAPATRFTNLASP